MDPIPRENYGASSDSQVEKTNDSSITSKLSCSNFGYFHDTWLQYFVNKPHRRSPIIHWGYYARFRAINYTVESIISALEYDNFQIISYGAGYDTTYFRTYPLLKSQSSLKYVELDLPSVAHNKANLVLKEPSLMSLLEDVQGKPFDKNDGIMLRSKHYCIVGINLMKLKELEGYLLNCGVDFLKKTLFLSECSIVYMDSNESTKLLNWSRSKFPNSLVLTYEQVRPDDAFGIFMCSHFNQLNTPIRGTFSYPDPADQQRRYLQAGWDVCRVTDVNQFMSKYVSQEEIERLMRIESFDEFEEFHLKCWHYVIVCAGSGTMFDIPGQIFGWSETPCISPSNAANHQTLDNGVTRFGHASVILSDTVFTIGGFGLTTGRHGRDDSVDGFNLTTYSHDTFRLENRSHLKLGRTFSRAVALSDDQILVIGGRLSPKVSLLDCVILSVSGVEDTKVTGIPVPIREDSPTPRWRHAVSLWGNRTYLFGGRNDNKVFDDLWYLETDTWRWNRVESDRHPASRHSHALESTEADLYLCGGLGPSMMPKDDLWKYNLKSSSWERINVDGLCPRYSFQMTFDRNKLILIGGVNLQGHMGIGVIHLNSLVYQEYNFSVSDPEHPIMLHNHDVVRRKNSLFVIGGGGNCFSFGTHFNEKIVEINLDQFINTDFID